MDSWLTYPEYLAQHPGSALTEAEFTPRAVDAAFFIESATRWCASLAEEPEQLALLAQELQRLRNALRGTNHHSAIRICALFTAGQNKLADNQTLQHGNQECAQQHQAGMQQRYINVENRINCTNHQSREKRAFDQ